MRQPRIFLSHRWALESHYKKTIKLFRDSKFSFYDHSITSDQPIPTKDLGELHSAIEKLIAYCDIFIIFDHPEVEDSFWCRFELDCAKRFNKHILIVAPSNPDLPSVVHEVLDSSPKIFDFIGRKEMRSECISTLIVKKIQVLIATDDILSIFTGSLNSQFTGERDLDDWKRLR